MVRRVETAASQEGHLAAAWGPDRVELPPMAFGVRYYGRPLEPDLVQQTLVCLARRHNALRMYFPYRTDLIAAACQSPADAEWPMTHKDLRGLPIDAAALAEREILDDIRQRMNLTEPPLLRAALITRDGDQLLALAIDHINFDGESVQLLLDDFAHVYHALTDGEDVAALSELKSDFVEFAKLDNEFLRSQEAAADFEYWATIWDEVGPYPTLPLPVLPDQRKTFGQIWSRDLDRPQARTFHDRAAHMHLSPFMLAATAIVMALQAMCGVADVGFVAPYARRHIPRSRAVIGYISSRLIVSTHAPAGAPFDVVSNEIRSVTLKAIQHGRVSYEALLRDFYPGQFHHQAMAPRLFLGAARLGAVPNVGECAGEFVSLTPEELFEVLPGLSLSIDYEPTSVHVRCGYTAGMFDDVVIDDFMEKSVRLMLGGDGR